VSAASPRLRIKDSYDITLGGAAATRLLPTAGLGGTAVTVWALRARGVRSREIAERLLAFVLLLYGVYAAAALSAGVAVASGLVHLRAGRELGIVAASLAAGVSALVLLALVAPARASKLPRRVGRGSARVSRAARRATDELPALRAALRRAWRELRRPGPALLGAVASWGFDVGVLLLMLRGFGVGLPVVAVVLAYFLGTLFNFVPLPGSLSSGLVGCLVALGAPLAGVLAAVLAYRAVAVWLPAAPGVASLARLRRGGLEAPRRSANRTFSREVAV
jgi:uncharacterized membrane protein YbhN (UPF0104 family)